MTTKQCPRRARRSFAVAFTLVCCLSVMSGQASEPNRSDGFSQGITSQQVWQGSQNLSRQTPRRLPSIRGLSITPSDALTTEQGTGSDAEFSGTTWKTKMVFERLELRAASSTTKHRTHVVLKSAVESDVATPLQQSDATTVSSSGLSQDGRCPGSGSASALAGRARVLVDRGMIEYRSGDWLSAESTVWEAFRFVAEGIDLEEWEDTKAQLGIRRQNAIRWLQFACTAIREAHEFSSVYDTADGDVIARMASSHSTDVLHGTPCDTLTGSDAADLYLDAARVALAGIASRSAEAAQGLDLLASIYLNQNSSTKFYEATALCLRRAAVQGQPDNASLASRLGMNLLDAGLLEEAKWALSHSLSIQEDTATSQAYIAVLQQTGCQVEARRVIAELNNVPQPRIRTEHVPASTDFTPQDFVAISRAGTPPNARQVAQATVRTVGAVDTTSARSDVGRDDFDTSPRVATQVPKQIDPAPKPNLFKSFADSIKKIW